MKNHNQKTLLLVEDEIVIAMYTKYKLEDFGYEVVKTDSGEEAVTLATQDATIDLILMDINLSGEMDGTDAAKQILAVRHIPIIFLTAYAEEEYVERVKEITRYGYVIKDSGDFVLKSSIEMAFELFREHEKTRKSEAFLNAVGKMAKVGGWELDAETQEVSWTEETYRIHEVPLDYKPPLEEAINFFHPQDRERLTEAIQKALNDGEPYDMELRFITAKGKQLWVRTICKPVFSGDKVVKLMGTFQDIDERKKAHDRIQEQNEEIQMQNEELRVTNDELFETLEKLRESEKKFKEIFNSTSEAIIIHDDKTGKMIDCNDVTMDMYGYDSKDEMLSLVINDFSAVSKGFDQQEITNHIQKAATDGSHTFEWLAKKKSGEEFWVEVSLRRTNIGGKGRILAVVRDINDRKQAQEKIQEQNEEIQMQNEELRVANEELAETNERLTDLMQESKESENKYRTLFESAKDAIFLADGETGIILDVNKRAEELLGIPKQDIIGMHQTQLHPENQDDDARKSFKDDMERKGKTIYKQFEVIHKDGHTIPVEISPTVVEIDGRPCVYGIFRDITERKSAEEELQKNLIKYQVIFESFPLGLTITDENGKIREANKRSENLLGISTDEHTKRRINGAEWKIIQPDGTPMEAEKYASVRALKEKKLIENVEMGIVKKDGDITWISVTAAPIPLENYGVAIAYGDITERKKAQEELEKSEERFRLVSELMSDYIYFLRYDAEKDWLIREWVTDSLTDLTGYTLDELDELGGWIPLTYPPDRPISQKHREAFKAGEEHICEYRIRTKNGQVRWLKDYSYPIRKNGKNYILGAAQDITKRKQAEEALKESEERFRMAVLHSGIIFAQTDRELRYTWISNPYPDFNSNSVIGRTDIEIVDNEGTKQLMEMKQQVIDTGKVLRKDIRFPLSDGIHTYDIIAKPLQNDAGEVIGVETWAQDITDRKRAEESLKASEKAWRDSFNSLEDIMMVIDKDFIIQKINQNGLDLLGLPRKKVIGKKCYELMHNNVEPDENCPFMKTLESRKVESMEWYEEAFDRYFSVKSSPIFDGNGEIVKFVDLIRDITELKRTEQQLKEVDKAKNLFFSIISHDLRNPLITLASGNELLVNRVDRYDKDHIRSIAEEMLDSSKNLLDLLNALFEWSKLQRGKMEYKPKKMDMFYIVEQVLQLFQSSADEKAVILNNDLEEDTFIYGDYNMVYTIVRNLINNAIKFTESGGEVIISAVEKGEFVEVSVSDTGVGMSPEKLCRLFRLGEPDISTKGTAGERGTGLGLILCKEFVDKHGGKIWAESEEGNGSTVTIALPKKRD